MASWWQRLFGKRSTEPPALPTTPAPEPLHLGSEDEAFLSQLVSDLAEGKRHDEIASPDVLKRLDGLWASGHERLAIDWMEKLLSVPEPLATASNGQRAALPAGSGTAALPEETGAETGVEIGAGTSAETGAASPREPRRASPRAPLRAALVERYEQRGELETALPHLETLTSEEPHALRAHYLLAEHARKTGDHARALRHYEAVLGRDVDYPNVRARVERLRQLTGRAAPVAGETIAAGEIVGVQAGARYRLVRELGRGATGVVYLARDAELDRDVAVKLLHPHLAGTERAGALARFFHEARVMASLRHPNVVAVLDIDEASRRIVMELAAGGTLRDVLRERGKRPLRRAIERHGQVLSALAAAHRRGIVHCDLKPANLMFRRDVDLPGVEVMLGDFGVAHLPDASGQIDAVAKRAEAIGTLAYMAPEQRRGEVSPAVDIYASAVVLYENLTGHTPWQRALTSVRTAEDFRLPDHVLAGVPGEVAEAIQAHLIRLGDPDAAKRPSTAQALADAQRLRERLVATEAV